MHPVYFMTIDKHNYIADTLCIVTGVIFVLSSACTKAPQTGPTIYSSASSLSYATEYPSQLQTLNKKSDDAIAKAKANWAQFNRFPGELSGPRWDEVRTVYETADMAGRSEAMVDWMRKSETVTEFIDTNDGVLSQRIGAHVNAQIPKAEKPAEGTKEFDSRPHVRWALKNSTTKVIDDRSRELNEARRFIAAYADSLGKKNIKVLETHVDKIAEASFLVNIVLLDLRQQMQAKVGETDEVKRTLDNEIERLQLIADAPESSPKDKGAAKEGIAELLKTKAPIDAEAQKARQNLDSFEQRFEQLQKEYRETFKNLLDIVDQKAAEVNRLNS